MSPLSRLLSPLTAVVNDAPRPGHVGPTAWIIPALEVPSSMAGLLGAHSLPQLVGFFALLAPTTALVVACAAALTLRDKVIDLGYQVVESPRLKA